MDTILQERNKIIQTKKTVDWLVKNTRVNVFNPITFEGYQRSIDKKHCDKIVSYLQRDFFLPTSIICACKKPYTTEEKLYIVDGQHRVHAFRLLKEQNPERYNEIRNKELSVIVLEQVKEEVEIDTFITINKTSKKVDTSLAYVLKNKINYNRASKDISISKREYLSVELASILNNSEISLMNLWEGRISFEGSPTKQSSQFISLNAFVKSMRSFLGGLEKYKIINLDWNNQEELNECISVIEDVVICVWREVKSKWPELFDSDLEKRRIIQGSIGFSSINRFLIQKLKTESEYMTGKSFSVSIKNWIRAIQLPSQVWLPGNSFSKYTSESGFSIIAQELFNSSKMGSYYE